MIIATLPIENKYWSTVVCRPNFRATGTASAGASAKYRSALKRLKCQLQRWVGTMLRPAAMRAGHSNDPCDDTELQIG